MAEEEAAHSTSRGATTPRRTSPRRTRETPRRDDGSVEENESPEGDDKGESPKSEVADRKATLRNNCAKIEYDAKLMN